jgi:Phosphate/sulphate permeases
MDSTLLLVVVIIAVALIFDYINGFHDAANSVATIVATRVLTPGQAVIWAAVFNFIAAFAFGTGVAKTVGKGMVDLAVVTPYVILAGLMGAIVWDLITWWIGLPTSSSHALLGGYAGAAMAKVAITPSWDAILLGGAAGGLGVDAGVYSDRALAGIAARLPADDCGLLDLPRIVAGQNGQLFP